MGRMAVAELEVDVDLPQTETSIRQLAKHHIKFKKKMKFYQKYRSDWLSE